MPTIAVDLLGSDLNANGVFALTLQSLAYAFAFDDSGAALVTDNYAYSSFGTPSVTLFDAEGNDITSAHTVSQDLVTSTPEPASLALVAVGLLGVAHIRRKT